jgi:hypothetical protein
MCGFVRGDKVTVTLRKLKTLTNPSGGFHLETTGNKKVAKKNETANRNSKSPADERAPFIGYVNITLAENDKNDFTAWEADADIVSEAYLSTLELGYQFTIKFDKRNEVYLCSVSQWSLSRSDAGLIYTARSDTPNKALLKAVYVVGRKLAYDLRNGYVNNKVQDAF